MTVVDKNGYIVFISPIHEDFFGLTRGQAIGQHVTQVIENTRLHIVAETGKPELAQIQQMRGTSRIVSRQPVFRGHEIVGAIGRIMFKGPDQLIAMSQEVSKLRTELEYYKREAHALRHRTYGLEDIVGTSDAIRQLKDDIARVAALDVPVLLMGESGTGKELVAQAVHRLSPRRDKDMVMVNAAALPASLVESELFGYEAGSFTGAQKKGRRGKFETAHNSSLFLDEIGDMPMDVQVKLLRVLQDGVFERVGGERVKYSNFRLITATNRKINELIEEERFRLDLYYRISAVVLELPALSDRPDDIPLLVQHFVASFNKRQRSNVHGVNPKVYGYLQERNWPGNVRQLLHEVERAMIFCDGPDLEIQDFRPLDLSAQRHRPVARNSAETLKDAMERVEYEAISEAMARHRGNKKRVAEELGVSRSYLYKRLEDFSFD
jgi:transcriptional regulator with PAS, ATPase and Fis domain